MHASSEIKANEAAAKFAWAFKHVIDSDVEGRVAMEPRGLININSTCFLNSVCQALTSCSFFKEFLARLAVVQALNTIPSDSFPFVTAFATFAATLVPEGGMDVEYFQSKLKEVATSTSSSGSNLSVSAFLPVESASASSPAGSASISLPAGQATAAPSLPGIARPQPPVAAPSGPEKLSKAARRRQRQKKTAKPTGVGMAPPPANRPSRAVPGRLASAEPKPTSVDADPSLRTTSTAATESKSASTVASSTIIPAKSSTASVSTAKDSDKLSLPPQPAFSSASASPLSSADADIDNSLFMSSLTIPDYLPDPVQAPSSAANTAEAETEGDFIKPILTKSQLRRLRKKQQNQKMPMSARAVTPNRSNPNSGTVSPAQPSSRKGSACFEAFAPVKTAPAFLPAFDSVLALFQNEVGRQEDAHEFFTCCMASLHAEIGRLSPLLPAAKEETPAPEEEVGHDDGDDDDDEWQEVGSKNRAVVVNKNKGNESEPTTPISSIFSGCMRLVLSRQAVATDTVSLQPFYSLHLDISAYATTTLEQALDGHMSRSVVEGYRSGNSKLETSASQQAMLHALPFLLVLHLKRFSFQYDQTIKISKRIDFPASLSIKSRHVFASRLRGPGPSHHYQLRAVVVHHGPSLHHGHYTAFVRVDSLQSDSTAQKGVASDNCERWLHCQDGVIEEVSPDLVYEQEAYMLFYETQSGQPVLTL